MIPGRRAVLAGLAALPLATAVRADAPTQGRLIEHRASVEGPTSSTPANLLRLSIGLEHAEDLIADLARALLGEISLSADEQRELDRFGNNNGGFDLGDLLALMARRGERLSPATLAALSKLAPNDAARPTDRRNPR